MSDEPNVCLSFIYQIQVMIQVANPAPTETAVTSLVNDQRRQRPAAAAAVSAQSQSQAKQSAASASSSTQAAVPYTSTSIASVVKVSFAEPPAAGSSSSVPLEPVDPYLDAYNKARALHEGFCAICTFACLFEARSSIIERCIFFNQPVRRFEAPN